MDVEKRWVRMPRNCPEYKEGVDQFINSAFNASALNGRIKCPCRRCSVTVYLDPKDVCEHLFCKGFDRNYANSVWVFHGEEPSPSGLDDESHSDEESNLSIDDMHGLLHDAFGFPNFYDSIGEYPEPGEGG
uniref:Transposase-associated domain-containing protein n=1 Tax=Chenopodium quinoa TaxID=63459 RepID=A0A803LLX3_CHEQI